MAEILEFVKAVGVPAAIAFFVLWRLDARLAELIREIRALHAGITQMVADSGRRMDQIDKRLSGVEHRGAQ